jgi:hypothetical protein
MVATDGMATGVSVGLPGEIFSQVRFEHTPLPADPMRLQLTRFDNPAGGSLAYIQTLRELRYRKWLFLQDALSPPSTE